MEEGEGNVGAEEEGAMFKGVGRVIVQGYHGRQQPRLARIRQEPGIREKRGSWTAADDDARLLHFLTFPT